MASAEPSELETREYRAGDEHAILAAFNAAFAAIDPAFRPRTTEAWRWQFLEHPHGRRVWIGLDREGRVVGQQASLPVRMQVGDETMFWSQVVDSFADPSHGRGLRKKGVYATTARGHSDRFGGEPPERDPIMYGMPVRPAWRIGRLYLDYEVCRSQDALCAELARIEHPAGGAVEVEEVERFPDEVSDLFERARGPHGALAIRDAAILDWRWLRRPGHRYRCALARRRGAGRELLGLAVQRSGRFDAFEGGLACDWLVVPGADGAARALRAWLAERTRDDGGERLVGIWPETCPDWSAFQRAGFRVRPTQYYNVICQYTARFDLRWLYWNWYYTLGDFDLC